MRHLLAQRLRVLRRLGPGAQDRDLARAEGDRAAAAGRGRSTRRARPRAGSRGPAGPRPAAAARASSVAPVGAVVEKDAGIRAAGIPVGGQQRLQLRAAVATRAGTGKLMAPDGHTVAQAPQPMHRCGSTLTWSPSEAIASVEQTSMQALQPVDRRAAVGAEVLAVGEVARLLELADGFAPLREHRVERRVVGDAPVALRRLVHARRAAGRRSRGPGRTPRRPRRAARAPGRRARSRGRRASRENSPR